MTSDFCVMSDCWNVEIWIPKRLLRQHSTRRKLQAYEAAPICAEPKNA